MDIKKLMDMGLTEEQAKEVMKSLDGAYVPKTRFDEVNTAKNQLEADIKGRDKQLDDLTKATGDVETLKNTIIELQQQNLQTQQKYETDIEQMKKNNFIDTALTAAKCKNPKATKALLDGYLETAKWDGESFKDFEKAIKGLREAEDSKMLFEAEETSTKPTLTGFVPGESGEKAPTGTYEARLAEARKNNNTLAAIQVKQEAAAEGVILL